MGAALWAAREHYIRLNPAEGQNRDAEPYALIVIRPSGADMNDLAQCAIRSADFEFGYELFEEDSDVKFGPPNPQLALVEQQAIDHARIRQEALAAAAPRAFRHRSLAASGRFEFDNDAPVGFSHGRGSGGGGRGIGGDGFGENNIESAGSSVRGRGGETGGSPPEEGQFAGSSPADLGNHGAEGAHAPGESTEAEGSRANGSRQTETLAGGAANAGASPNVTGNAMPGIDPEQMSAAAVSTGAASSQSEQSSRESAAVNSEQDGGSRVTQQARKRLGVSTEEYSRGANQSYDTARRAKRSNRRPF